MLPKVQKLRGESMSRKSFLILFTMLPLFFGLSAFGGESEPTQWGLPVKFTLKPDSFRVLSGGTIQFTATAEGNAENVGLVAAIGNYIQSNAVAMTRTEKKNTFTGAFRLEEFNRGRWDFFVMSDVDGELAVSAKVSVLVVPDMKKIGNLSIKKFQAPVEPRGTATRLQLIGVLDPQKTGLHFASDVDLTDPAFGTAFASGNPAIATVTNDGTIKIHKMGTTRISAAIEGRRATALLTVTSLSEKSFDFIISPDKP